MYQIGGTFAGSALVGSALVGESDIPVAADAARMMLPVTGIGFGLYVLVGVGLIIVGLIARRSSPDKA